MLMINDPRKKRKAKNPDKQGLRNSQIEFTFKIQNGKKKCVKMIL